MRPAFLIAGFLIASGTACYLRALWFAREALTPAQVELWRVETLPQFFGAALFLGLTGVCAWYSIRVNRRLWLGRFFLSSRAASVLTGYLSLHVAVYLWGSTFCRMDTYWIGMLQVLHMSLIATLTGFLLLGLFRSRGLAGIGFACALFSSLIGLTCKF